MVNIILGPCKPEVKDTAYNMLVRPKPEYASPIWNPHTSSQINRLKIIQHYAARFVANDHRRTTSPTTLVNLSITTGVFPSAFKKARVFPFRKKTSLDQNELNSYRPVSKLSLVSKIAEKVVAARFSNHLTDNGLYEQM